MAEATNFIEQIVESDLAEGKVSAVQTRFPPEPNGYLHIGHAKSMFVNFGTALKYGGKCNLFFDDTNPSKEKTEFVDAIRADIRWLGYEWARECYASDFFDTIYEYAEKLILDGKAFVCDLSPEEIKNTRGTLTEPGVESPYRNRTPEENLRLFEEMRAGKYKDGEKCLRAKIDMASPNVNLRDPVIYPSCTRPITARATSGASIRCTTLLMDKVTISKESLIRSVRWNLRFIGRFTIGFWIS